MYREVTIIELREVLRLWQTGLPKKRLAAQLGLDPKTVRRYLAAAAATGVRADGGAVSDEQLRDVLLALHPTTGGRPRGDGWSRCQEQRAAIQRWLTDRLRLTKIRKLLARTGCPDRVSEALSLRRPGVAVWAAGTDDSDCRWRGWSGTAGRHRLGRVADAVADPAPAAAFSRVDLHCRPVTPSLRLSHLRRNHGPRH